jgi:nucleoside-diphosphate-sugar epimerase
VGEKAVLVTGAAGEVGLSLIDHFLEEGAYRVIALDLARIAKWPSATRGVTAIQGDITDRALVRDLFAAHDIRKVFHLAAVLSSTAEKRPGLAHDVNVNGSFHLLQAARDYSQEIGEPVQFIFPSSIAVYGIPTPEMKRSAGAVREDQFLTPITMYGLNKLYIENIGQYFACRYGLLEPAASDIRVDFRALRLPGLLSAETVPTGGTSDYASQMVHACAHGRPYASFASPEIKIPFMAMPDAVRALISLSAAPRDQLSQTSYNVSAFAVSVDQISGQLLKAFPRAAISCSPDPKRESILNSWPEDTDDSRARADWGWRPEYSFESCFDDYLVPGISRIPMNCEETA